MQQQNIDKKQQQERLSQLLALAQLNGAENLYPSQISGGMKQRTAVIRALASDPEILLMDEPFGAVDYQMRQNLQEEFEALWQKKPKPQTCRISNRPRPAAWLHLETDYAESDTEQLRVRIEAYLEMIS